MVLKSIWGVYGGVKVVLEVAKREAHNLLDAGNEKFNCNQQDNLGKAQKANTEVLCEQRQ